ncbi:tRNA pseudouridine(13) synthase TruD [Geotalea uraniireducens]|uniref:tRNA pseudouridine synthase D n=1 Tax=Geotalea uraniireducens (strain Rf4) TaxID=351605 RepID=A5GB60_GEOUR|nr:tRNA pseudouridine(13) synthase TruD [Geotalea uraniireducens]ABQ25177.1 tRNA pseudouridine synthase D, TruD [Geotalea uraniireducens Rf4]
MLKTYLTADLPGTGGTIKETPEDFLVAEIPLYLPCGEGEHTFAEIEKRGITTLEALRRLAKALGIAERDMGYAGMKDARGVTRQTFSIPRVAPDRVLGLEVQGIRVLSASLHRNKLKLGHLRGNRFRLRVRGVTADAVPSASAVLSVLAKRGVPNYFGEQRYGTQGNSHLIGAALLRGDYRGAVDALIGDAAKVTDERWRAAIEAYRRGDPDESLRAFPGHCRTERDLLQRLVKQPDDWEKAFRAVHPRLKKLYLSAFQSFLFDRLLDGRLDRLDEVVDGDVAYKHDNGACFLVTDAAAEAVRAEAFEISPTGPLFGCKMKEPEGKVLELERQVLDMEGLSLESFNLTGGLRMEGERRPLRVPLMEPTAEWDGEGLVLEFGLPRGSYATAVLREVMKSA